MDEFETLRDEAQRYFDEKDFTKALDGFKRLRDLRPAAAFFADRYAHCHSALRQWPQACESWLQAIGSHGKSLGRVNALGACYIELRDFPAACALFGSSRGEIDVNANFFVFAAIAYLGVGNIGEALTHAQEVEGLALQEKVPAVSFLCGHLDLLVLGGHAEKVLRLTDLLLPSLKDPSGLLMTGIGAATVLQRWDAKLGYADRLIFLVPGSSQGHFHRAETLLETRRFEECRKELAALAERFPAPARSFEENRRFENLEFRLSSWTTWDRLLAKPSQSKTFQALNLRATAHMTLKQYKQAIEVASEGLALHHQHPWFMLLLGKCHEEKGDLESALTWFAKCAEADSNRTLYLIYLCKTKIKLGFIEEAKIILYSLMGRHPNLPVLNKIYKDINKDLADESKEYFRDLPSSNLGSQTWLHCGDSGDIIYALAAMRAGGGGHLHLTGVENTREPMSDAKIEFLSPLLTAQPYVTGAGRWEGEVITKDFVLFPHAPLPDVDLVSQQWRCVIGGIEPDVRTPWLTVPISARHGRPVFARSSRYRNWKWDGFWKELKNSTPNALFVGTADEFAEFGHGEHYLAKDALDLAQVIAGASIFVGNQSLPYAIAEGLKVGRLLEVSPFTPNCTFPGALALDFRSFDI